MNETQDGKAADLKIISFFLGEQLFSVNIMSVREIRGWTPATPLAHVPRHVLGVINLRGAVIPVVDMALRLGLAAIAPTERSAIIVTSVRGQLVGLLVDNVSDMVTVSAEEIQSVPEIGATEVQRMTTSIISKGSQMISHLDIDSVLDEAGALAA
ncbi:chemotaxis signal transduction protein [Hoeflea sp. IMCC20628]|uniref:chemotaxis protein CheW n=1 Tax=Hoeflea sp. IMCC20628 TaxID=1620421 RepID=UPI00063AFFFB|nr:chemotaxis protein CheW [Hoeflea sp. IMCC20628]AKI01667.1 chemotaxis signal transduction protein [Hoeflea sp. IMCC20628]